MQIAPFAGEITPELADTATTDLERMFYAHQGQICHRWHHMLALYDAVLGSRRNSPVRVLEIGVRFGGSMDIWREFFGSAATIHGLDIDENCAQFDTSDHPVHIGSQTDLELLDKIIEQMGGVDVVIDDGGHFNEHQIATFNHLYPKLATDGIYICEDTHTSYWPRFGGGLRKRGSDGAADVDPSQGSFIEFAKDHIDLLHGFYLEEELSTEQESFLLSTRSIEFHDSVVIFRRGQRSAPFHLQAGTRQFSD